MFHLIDPDVCVVDPRAVPELPRCRNALARDYVEARTASKVTSP
jgi:hypothetical protein